MLANYWIDVVCAATRVSRATNKVFIGGMSLQGTPLQSGTPKQGPTYATGGVEYYLKKLSRYKENLDIFVEKLFILKITFRYHFRNWFKLCAR